MIVIPMAGLSRRFQDAGYQQPKYMLQLHGRSVFAHAVDSFRAYFGTEPFLFIARSGLGAPTFIDAELARLGIASARTVELPHPTLGQADTVRLGLEMGATERETPLTIFNIDTFRPGFCYPQAGWMDRADGYLEVMPGSDPGFSYVRPAPEGEAQVAETAEKVVISNLASTGLYWFRRAGDFLAAMQDGTRAAQAHGELYVAPLYNALIAAGLDIRYRTIQAQDVVFCGTPAQFEGLAGRAAAFSAVR